MPNIDCFAYNEKLKTCSVLSEMVCKKRKCSFYKTEQQYKDDLKKYGEIANQSSQR